MSAPTSTRAPIAPTPTARSSDWVARAWQDRRLALLAATGLVVAVALVTAWWTPRGPLTTVEALVSMIGAVLLGIAVGLLLGTRWAMLAAPLAYAAVFELARIGTAGPTVDAIQWTTMIGILALVVGRGIHGLLVLLPMVVGAGWGVWLARRRGHPTAPAPGAVGRVALILVSLLVLVMGVGIARPASTAPILGPDGQPLAGSIAEFETVRIGGVDQVLMLRGRSVDNPVLLYLAGGPGGTDIGAMRDDVGLEQDFVVVTWEQRGTGKSYASSIDPVEDLTLAQAVDDTIAVTDHLRERFGVDKVFLVANSWGTIPSTLAAQRAPDRFAAYVGTGQMVDNRLTDQMFYEDALAWAEQEGNDDLAATIRAAGPPPYEDLTRYQVTVGYEHQWNAYPGVEDLNEMPFNTFVPETTWMERINAMRAMLDVNFFVYPQLQDHDFREDVPALDVPVVMVIGEHEARGRSVLARDWFDQLDAPDKQLVVVEGAGHRPSFEDPAGFSQLMREVATAVPAASVDAASAG